LIDHAREGLIDRPAAVDVGLVQISEVIDDQVDVDDGNWQEG